MCDFRYVHAFWTAGPKLRLGSKPFSFCPLLHLGSEPVEGVGTSVLVFETKEHADEAARYPVPPMPGVTVLDLTIREVFAHV